MSRWTWTGCVAVVGLLLAVAITLGIALHPLAVDDAFITFRYARNLAIGQGFAYNVGRPALESVGKPVLSTTAPLYALLLAGGGLLWSDLPALANALSAIALWLAAVTVFFLGRREGTPWVGAMAALFSALHPLLWLSLGLETAVFLAMAIGAITAYRSGRLYWTAVLLALTTLIRGDGLILTAVVAADWILCFPWLRGRIGLAGWLHRIVGPARMERIGGVSGRPAGPRGLQSLLRVVAVYVAAMLPLLAWLTWKFGSPLPDTLGAKVAQAELGITGFYAHTTFLQGMGILARARLAQSPLYLLFIPAVIAGLLTMWRQGGWIRLVVAWGAAHLIGYTVLGVTPYYWYYAPLLPALACLAALGVVASACWGIKRFGALGLGIGALWALALLGALVVSDVAMVRALDGPVPPPEDPVSKVLPEAKIGAYERAGRWLFEHTPSDALVGVTEVGVMGYHAQRPMVDFLGLLEPDVAEALARGDLYWALLYYQPDYLALTGVSPLYAYDLRTDPWFQAAYVPVESFDDARFWGSPVTIYQRRVDRTPLISADAAGLPEGAIPLDQDFGEQIRLLGVVTGKGDRQPRTVQPGDVLELILYWEALAPIEHDYTVFVHLLGEHERVLAQRDAAPGLGARPTSQWAQGQVVADPYLLALPEAAYAPDQAVWEVGLYDAATGQRLPVASGGDNVRFGAVSVQPAAEPARFDFGPVALTGYELDRLSLAPGEVLGVSLHWDGDTAVEVTVQLVDEAGAVQTQASGDLNRRAYALTLAEGAPPGAYDLEVLLTHQASGQLLPLLGADGQPRGDRVRLTKVRLCR